MEINLLLPPHHESIGYLVKLILLLVCLLKLFLYGITLYLTSLVLWKADYRLVKSQGMSTCH